MSRSRWAVATVIATAIFTFALVPGLNGLTLSFLKDVGLISGSFTEHSWIAAILEPITSKLLPLVVVSAIAATGRLGPLPTPRWWIGILQGAAFGVTELYYRMLPEFELLFWQNPNYDPGLLAPAFILHPIAGFIIGISFLAVLTSETEHDKTFIAGSYLLVLAIHWIWNTVFLNYQWFWKPFRNFFIGLL